MKVNSILSVDSYVVINRSLLNENDRKVLIMLYQPLIGSLATSLYFSLWTDLNKSELMSREFTHHHLMTVTKMNIDQILDSRIKLEAFGLLKTYCKCKEINNYIYEIYSPLSASDFFSNPILSYSLCSSIGKTEYENTINYFKIPKISMNDYQSLTTKFSDVYNIKTKDIEDYTEENIKSKKILNLEVDDVIDFDLLEKSTNKFLNKNALSSKIKRLINEICYLYKFDLNIITNLIRESINDKNLIDENLLKKNCKNYFLFENNDKKPMLVYKSKNDIIDKNNIKNLREKLVACFNSVTPYEFLKSKYNGGKPTNKDVSLLEGLLLEQKLNPGVINVLVDYVLRVNDKKLNKNLIEAIASQWKMLNINDVDSAMKQAEKEYKKRYKKESKNEVKLPNWYNKEIKKEELTKEEEKELKSMLEEFN